MLGFDQHYTLDRFLDRDGTISVTFYVIMATAVLFPLTIYVFTKILKVDPKKDYDEYIKKKTDYINEPFLFWIVLIVGVICLSLLALYINKIGYIPLVKLFWREPDLNLATERIRIGNGVLINVYVTNILILLAIPVIAYFCFACAISSKKARWYILSVIFFIASIITKTYNFEKSQLLYFLLVYILIYILYNGGIKKKWIISFGILGISSLLGIYTLMDISYNVSDIYNGVWGRTLFTPVGAFGYNFDLFPDYIPFLKGLSFNKAILSLLGMDPSMQVRSSRIIMEFYGSQSVYEGTAGVMNSFFVGEAYANFGWLGAGFSLIWVGFVFAGLFALAIKMKKSPAMLTLISYFTVHLALTTQGGFVDFVYNVSWIIVILSMLLCHFIPFWSLKYSQKKSIQKV
ncbi:MAG: oligosaccharide repeat unit polymerase [Clostridiales bacterium]|nr:oligosaccharide repeat unit polymerase [Clostridiales bacterium]